MSELRTEDRVVAWLIEGGNPPHYYCGPGDWCSNPSHALKFPTQEAAELRAAGLRTMDPIKVTEHEWS